jgi:hypothetical protein
MSPSSTFVSLVPSFCTSFIPSAISTINSSSIFPSHRNGSDANNCYDSFFDFLRGFDMTNVNMKGWNLSYYANPNNSFLSEYEICINNWDGISCNEFMNIINIDLSHRNLVGYLSENSFKCVEVTLQSLNLSYNHISAHLPYSMRNMTALQILDMQHNQFGSSSTLFESVPSSSDMEDKKEIKPLPEIFSSDVDVSFYVFHGMKSLRQLDISYNNMTGIIPSMMCDLKFLSLFHAINNFDCASDCLIKKSVNVGNNFTLVLSNQTTTCAENITHAPSSFPTFNAKHAVRNVSSRNIHFNNWVVLLVLVLCGMCFLFVVFSFIIALFRHDHNTAISELPPLNQLEDNMATGHDGNISFDGESSSSGNGEVIAETDLDIDFIGEGVWEDKTSDSENSYECIA